MKLRKNMKLGVSFIFLLLTLTSCLSLINLTKKNNTLDENTLSLSATIDDYMEDNDSFGNASWVTQNNYTNLMIIESDEDWFQFNLNTGDTIDVEIYFNHSKGDLDLELWDPTNTSRDYSYSVTDNESISFIANIPGPWRIWVYHYMGDTNVTYDMDIWVSPMVDDFYEPNNDRFSAFDLSFHQRQWLSTINGSGTQADDDYFKIYLDFGQHIEINLTIMGTIGNIDIQLLDFSGFIVAGSFLLTNFEHINYNASFSGDYYIKVFGDNATIQYDLWWGSPSLGASDDLYEENDDWSTATDLTSYEGWWLSSINGSGLQRDEDWYKISISSGKEHIRINLTFDHWLGDINLQFYDSSLTWSFSRTSTTDNEFMDITVPGSGIYYIKVYFENAGNPYDLRYNTLFAPDDSYEENDQEYEFYDLTANASMWQNNLRQFDDDWYEIRLDPGEERLRAELNFNHLAGNMDLEIYDRDFYYIDGSYLPGDSEYLEFDLAWSGIYYLRVFGDNMGNFYNLFWEDLPLFGGMVDWEEPNDDFLNARRLDPNYYSNLWIIGADEDWFQVYLNNGDNIEVNILFNHMEGNLKIELWNPSNMQRQVSHSITNGESLSFTAIMEGNWRIRVLQISGNYDVYYDLEIWVDYGGDD
ncbi:hypothetical protein LCGC14_2060650, partial [marine sediment metagenome]